MRDIWLSVANVKGLGFGCHLVKALTITYCVIIDLSPHNVACVPPVCTTQQKSYITVQGKHLHYFSVVPRWNLSLSPSPLPTSFFFPPLSFPLARLCLLITFHHSSSSLVFSLPHNIALHLTLILTFPMACFLLFPLLFASLHFPSWHTSSLLFISLW